MSMMERKVGGAAGGGGVMAATSSGSVVPELAVREGDDFYMHGSNMKHSLSTPSGVDGTPSTPRHRGGKKITVRIQMLDDTVTIFQVQVSKFFLLLFCILYVNVIYILFLTILKIQEEQKQMSTQERKIHKNAFENNVCIINVVFLLKILPKDMKYYFVYTKELESIKCEKLLVKEMYLKKATNY